MQQLYHIKIHSILIAAPILGINATKYFHYQRYFHYHYGTKSHKKT